MISRFDAPNRRLPVGGVTSQANQLGRTEEARVAFDRAIALANTPAEAAHIREQLDRLAGGAAL
jgi:predicted RNA polymerase sigma factor